MSEACLPEINVALHVHTIYSPCAETRLEEIGEYCRTRGVDVLGVTDHDTIAGALALKKMLGDVRVIIGEEIRTRQGEIIGLFLNKEIEPNLDARETCKRIKDQGGLIYIPHPFDPFKIPRLRPSALMRVLDMVDMIEVFNAKTLFPVFSNIASRFTSVHGKIPAAGSDAHYLSAIDLCVNRMQDFSNPAEFLESFRNAQLQTHTCGPFRQWWVGIKNVLTSEGHRVRRYGGL